MKRKLKTKIKAFLLAVIMIITSVGITTVKDAKADTLSIRYWGPIEYAGTTIGNFTDSTTNKQIFCMQHNVGTPPDNAIFNTELYDNDTVRRVLYYGCEGEGIWDGLKNQPKALQIWVTTLAISQVYYDITGGGGETNPSWIGFNYQNATSSPEKALLKSFLDGVVYNTSSYATPGAYGTFKSASGTETTNASGGNKLTMTTVRDELTHTQHTDWIDYKNVTSRTGQVRAITFSVPTEATVVMGNSSHIETGVTYAGGTTATINSGDSFYIYTSLQQSKGGFDTGVLSSGYMYQPIRYYSPSGYQILGGVDVIQDPTYSTELVVNWDTTSSNFDKVDDNNRPLKGATLWLFKAHGYTKTETAADLIDSWTTDGTTHTIEGLVPGQLYRLYEAEAPVGYTKADDIYFTVDANTGKSSVTMQDIITKTKVDKVDENGTPVSGAEFWLFKANGYNKNETAADLVDSWTTDGTTHTIKGLEIGRLYRLYEAKAPVGYARAADKYFTVEADGTTDVVIVDAKLKTEIEKIDDEGNVVKGAVLATYDSTGKEIERWTTGKDKYNLTASLYVENATYTLKEIQVPDGYKKAPDQTFVFSSTQNTVTMVDAKYKTEFAKVDENGKGIIGATIEVTDKADGKVVDTWITDGSTHTIKGLTLNKTYVMTETVVPDGYIKSAPVEFTFTADNQTVTMTDLITKTEVSKVDENGNSVVGAKLQILDGKTVVDEWVSDGTVHTITGLKTGKSYTLHEVSAPAGYEIAKDKVFTVSTTDATNALEMVDARTETDVVKVDDSGIKLAGAVLQITDKDGKVIDEWVTSKDNVHTVKGLMFGETYAVTEISAPAGYALADPITFVADGSVIKMIDLQTETTFTKTNDDEKPVIGAKMQITDKDGNVVDAWTTTDKPHIVKGLVIGETYTYSELEAPEGYAVAAPVTFTVTGTGQIIKMVDTKIVIDSPHTGDSFPVLPVAGTGVLALALIGAIVIFKKKKEQ